MDQVAHADTDSGERVASESGLIAEVGDVEIIDVPPVDGSTDTGTPNVGAAALDTPERAEPSDDQGWSVGDMVGLAAAVLCSLFVFFQMQPSLLLADTTPSGGDMGAHVWGPAFLRDHLLPELRLTGWTPDWYAGFPAYQFYMVVPSLAIVAINAGLRPLLGIPVVLAVIVLAFVLTKESPHRRWIRIAAVLGSLLLLSVPYGIAFKLVSVSGLVTFPLSAWLFGRLARAPAPIPGLLAIASLFFLYDTNFSIYGGNIASTLAGEFAFSMSLSLCLVAFGLVARGMDLGRGRAVAAIVISLIALTHLIPVFFAMAALVALVVMGRDVPRLWPVATAVAFALVPVAFADGSSVAVIALAIGAAVIVLGAVMLAEREVWSRAKWLLVTGPVAIALTGFWLLPFYLREPFFNDMGWERLDEVGPALLTVPMQVALPVAAIGVIAAIAYRERVGLVFMTTGLVFAAAVANIGEGALWNARLLPFYYLSVYFLAAVGAGFVFRFAAVAVSENLARPDERVTVAFSAAALVAGLIAVAMPLRILPGGSNGEEGTYEWMGLTSHAKSFLPSWTSWNYSGYEEKPSYREYESVVATMGQVGEVNGCGRAMWEYTKELDRYGTPMALMLLPHWTDGCIGSMEGLYFESSATTPFHFLNQSMLSQAPSRAQRDLPYQSFDINRGIAQLQVMGVRYYMAQTDDSIAAAREHPELTEVAEAQPFVIFQVAGSDLVEGLAVEPVVVSGQTVEAAGEVANRFDIGWVSEAVRHYNDPVGFDALPAEDGPGDWDRATALLPSDGERLEATVVSDISVDTSSISFSVDQVGQPVLVKASYFPNWDVNGARGPWRVGPNLMAVIPTENEVELRYGRTLVDWLGYLLTLAGWAAIAGLVVYDRRRLAEVDGDVWSGADGAADAGWGDDLSGLAEQPVPAPEVELDEPDPTFDESAPAFEPEPVAKTPVGRNGNGRIPPVVAELLAEGTDGGAELEPTPEIESRREAVVAEVDVETRLSTEVGRDQPNET